MAQKLGRDWIGCDSSWRAVRTAAGRLSRHLPSVASVPSADESCASPEHDVKGVSSRQGSGYQILRLGGEDSAYSSLHRQDLHASPATEIRLLQDDDRLTVRIVKFQSPQVARLAANANVELPPDWRAQARAILIDPDFDGKTLQPELVDAPAGKSALVEGAYCCALSLLRGGHNRDRAPDRSVAILIVDVAGEGASIRRVKSPISPFFTDRGLTFPCLALTSPKVAPLLSLGIKQLAALRHFIQNRESDSPS